MKQLKCIFSELIILFQQFILWLPFWPIRWLWLKIVLKKLGKNTYISRNIDLRKPGNIKIGNNCVVNKSVLLDGRGGMLQIGNNVDIAQECMIWTLSHDIDSPMHSTKSNNTCIEDNVWLCTRCIILPGVTIHKGAVVGASSVVHKSVDTLTVVAGNPCRMIKRRKNDLTYILNHHKLFI